jgi:hypothetical protein
LERRRAPASASANTVASAASGPPGAGIGEAAHVAFVVVVSVPVHVFPVHDALPVEVTEMSIFVVRTAFKASTQLVRLLPTST